MPQGTSYHRDALRSRKKRASQQRVIELGTYYLNERYRAVATLIITSMDISDTIADGFVGTHEIDSLVSIHYSDIVNGRLSSHVSPAKLINAKKIYPDARIQPGYLHRHILRDRPDLKRCLLKIPKAYKIICQVECPNKRNKRYKNIDVGFTSNGKCELVDRSLMDCSIRETYEETGITLSECQFSPSFQLAQRARIDASDVPLYITCSNTFCYILFLHLSKEVYHNL